MNEFQEPYEKEISLTELLFFCLKKWRWIVAAMILLGAAAGVYKYSSAVSSNQAKQELQLASEEDREHEGEEIFNPNVEYYNRAISKTEKELEETRAYIDDSVIMQLDAYSLDTGNLSFYITMEEAGETLRRNLLGAYEDFVTGGRLAEAILEADDSIPESELQYLISFESREQQMLEESYALSDGDTASVVQIAGSYQNTPNVFRIQITTGSAESCESCMAAARSALEAFAAELQSRIGAHRLTLVSESQTKRIDLTIQSYQKEVMNNYTTAFNQLSTLETELETVLEEEGETIVVGGGATYENPLKEAVKFAVIGMVLGAFAAAFLLVVVYLMSGRLRSLESFREEFGMPLLGQVTKAPAKKRLFGFVDRWLQRLEEGEYADVTYEEQLKIAAANLKTAVTREDGISRVMIAGTMARDEAEDFCSRLRPELEGVGFSGYERIVFQASALEELDSFDGVVFLEKKGCSYEKLIKKERDLVADRGVRVLGVIVL